jgi:hypothetical protein
MSRGEPSMIPPPFARLKRLALPPNGGPGALRREVGVRYVPSSTTIVLVLVAFDFAFVASLVALALLCSAIVLRLCCDCAAIVGGVAQGLRNALSLGRGFDPLRLEPTPHAPHAVCHILLNLSTPPRTCYCRLVDK